MVQTKTKWDGIAQAVEFIKATVKAAVQLATI